MAMAGRKHAVKIAVGAAAVGVATSVTAVAVTQPASISASLVDLTALIVVGSSTNPSGAGVEDFFGGKFRDDPTYTGIDHDDIIRVNFWDGPAGIRAALEANPPGPGEKNAVLASGWGAANASLLLLRNDPELSDTLFVLDNDVARPDGGFGTRYPWFALIGVNPNPTPSQTPASWVVNTGYEYDYNSNAPGYVLNPFSAVNALAAYLTTRLNQADIDLPVNPDGTSAVQCDANTCAMTERSGVLACPDARCVAPVGDRITAYVTERGNTTYVTYTTRELPLTTVVRGIFGDYIADVTAPLLKWAVDFGYHGGNPIPSDPSAYRPARFIPSIGDIVTALLKLPGAIIETLAAIVSPFQPRQVAPTDNQMTTEMLSTPEGTEQETEEVTERLSTGEGTEELTTPALTTDELTTETPEELKAPGEITEDTAPPLTNVRRNGLRGLTGEFSVDPDNDSTTRAIDPESVEPEHISELEEDTDPTVTDPTDIDTDVEGAETDKKPGDNDDGSPESDQAAAA